MMRAENADSRQQVAQLQSVNERVQRELAESVVLANSLQETLANERKRTRQIRLLLVCHSLTFHPYLLINLANTSEFDRS